MASLVGGRTCLQPRFQRHLDERFPTNVVATTPTAIPATVATAAFAVSDAAPLQALRAQKEPTSLPV